MVMSSCQSEERGGFGAATLLRPASGCQHVIQKLSVTKNTGVLLARVLPGRVRARPGVLHRGQGAPAERAVAIGVFRHLRLLFEVRARPGVLHGGVQPGAVEVRKGNARWCQGACGQGAHALVLAAPLREADVREKGAQLRGGVVSRRRGCQNRVAEHLGHRQQPEVCLAGSLLAADGGRRDGRYAQVVPVCVQPQQARAAAEGAADPQPLRHVGRLPRGRHRRQEAAGHEAAHGVAEQRRGCAAVCRHGILHQRPQRRVVLGARDAAEVVRRRANGLAAHRARAYQRLHHLAEHDAVAGTHHRVQILHAAGVAPAHNTHLNTGRVAVGRGVRRAGRPRVVHLPHVVGPTVHLPRQQLLHVQP
mmetsp:Transcript_37859/g.96934  ORF Transcript_37859/g.96934 Transcript_37859/m.96934 type:complete len:363 (-) Transcript_37859:541-1629(-)